MNIDIVRALAAVVLFSTASVVSAAESASGPTPDSIHIQRCSACHYVDGRSAGPEFPNIGGQYEVYLMKALKMFQDNQRESEAMQLIASLHQQQELVILASYYARQPPAQGSSSASPDQTLVERGRRLYSEERVYGIACIDCHGPDAKGYVRKSPRTAASRGIPSLAGQRPAYLKAMLQKYSYGEFQSGMCTMRKAAKDLSASDIDALVEFLASK